MICNKSFPFRKFFLFEQTPKKEMRKPTNNERKSVAESSKQKQPIIIVLDDVPVYIILVLYSELPDALI
jgi:hypothetical protein